MIETFLRYQNLLKNLISRDFKVKYRRSFLGVLWSLLNPILIMLVLSAVFSTIFRNSLEYFPIYLICGQTLFTFYTEATNGALGSVVGSSALIKKVYVPKYIFPLEKVLFAFVNLLFSFAAVVIIMIFYGVPWHWTVLLFPVPLIALLLFSLGMGLILATLCVFFRDIQHLYSVITTAWLYLTPLFYDVKMLAGNEFIYTVVKLNPLTAYITYFRGVMIYGTMPTLETNLVCFGWGFAVTAIGLWFFKSKQDRFILHI